MSFFAIDTKGDLYRNYGGIAKDCYGYNVAVIDLRNLTKSDGNNLLHLVNKYMDLHKANPGAVAYRAKAEKYTKIISKTLIYGDGDASAYGQNDFFYDSAEGLLTFCYSFDRRICRTEGTTYRVCVQADTGADGSKRC